MQPASETAAPASPGTGRREPVSAPAPAPAQRPAAGGRAAGSSGQPLPEGTPPPPAPATLPGEERGARTFADVEREVWLFTDRLAAQARAQARPAARPSGPRGAPRLRQLYRDDPAKATREVLEGPSMPCPIPLEELHRHFQEVFAGEGPGAAPRPENLPRLRRVERHEGLEKAFSPAEVSANLRRRRIKGSAPGEDGISYSLLRELDPEGDTLAAIFEGCKSFRTTPAAWKKATTTLLFKNGDPNDPSSWRPIFLCNTQYKVYASCLAARISQWAQSGQDLGPHQKNFKTQEGCPEHRFLLRSVLDEARRSGRECAVAFLDLANAFGSISRDRIFETLAEFGMPGSFLDLLRDLYKGWTTTIKVKGKKTTEIDLQVGLKQGCPLSHIMFALGIEPLLRCIDSQAPGFRLYDERVSILAYVDDLLLFAENATDLQKMLDNATAAADWLGLCFSAKKCRTLHFRGGASSQVWATRFTVQREEMPCLAEGEAFCYLGMPVGVQSHMGTGFADDFVNKIGKIRKSPLLRWQKADMTRKKLLPKLMSAVKEGGLARKDVSRIEKVYRRALLAWDSYGESDRLEQLIDMEVVAHAYLLLTSPDTRVKAIAHGALCDTIHKSSTKVPSMEDLASYLNGSREKKFRDGGGGFFSLWNLARKATQRLDKLLGCRWLIYEGELCVEVSGRSRIGPNKRKTLAPTLKRAVKQWALGARQGF